VKVSILMAVLVLVFSVSAVAHDGPGSPAFLFVVEAEIEKAQIGSWTTAVRSLIAAHDAHADGSNWVVFRELTGGPKVGLTFFRGFSKMAELDEWPSNRKILVDVLGPEKGGGVKEELTRGVESSDRVISRVDELSNPWTSHDPPKYLWVATVQVADGKMTEYAALSKRVRRAFEEHADDMWWMCYANTIGGDNSELIFFYGFDSFSEVDSWPSRREVLATSLGASTAERLASAIESITQTTTSLWKLEPELSRLDLK